MINVFRSSGFDLSIRATPGAIEVEFPISLTDTAIQHFEDRETQAAISAMRTFLAPRSVAVIGASRDSSAIGGRLFHNLLMTEFSGSVFPVNPKADVVHGVVAYPNVEAIPGDVDVAFVAVPAIHVEEIARQCGLKGVRGLVVISAGFAEVGDEGVQRQARLLGTCRSYGMRLIGPNCMGIVNTAEDVRLNGTFANVYPPAGRVGFSSQSGALGLAVTQYAAELGLGLSSFVSVGNKADISGNDLIAYWSVEERTEVILLYLESFGNPRRFARLAREIGKSKPIIAVKSGRSIAGRRAGPASHTGALLATSDVTVDALFRQAGVIRTDTLEEMFDVATILANQPPPKGEGVAIVTNAGGLGILCADACEAHGLHVAALAEQSTAALRSFLSAEASLGNPVDMIGLRDGLGLSTHDRDRGGRPRSRRHDRDLHPTGEHEGRRDRRGDRRGDRRARRADPRGDGLVVHERAPGAASEDRDPHPVVRVSGTGCDRDGARDSVRPMAREAGGIRPHLRRCQAGRGVRHPRDKHSAAETTDG